MRVILSREPGDAGYEGCWPTPSGVPARGASSGEDTQGSSLRRRASLSTRGSDASPLRPAGSFPRRGPGRRGAVLPHEKTRAAAKEDRWRVLNATGCELQPDLHDVSRPRRPPFGPPSLDVLVCATHRTIAGRRRSGASPVERGGAGACRGLCRPSWLGRRPTSPMATIATRQPCAIAMRTVPTAPSRFGYFTPIAGPGSAGAAVSPDPVVGADARRSPSRGWPAGSTLPASQLSPRPRVASRRPRRPTPSPWPGLREGRSWSKLVPRRRRCYQSEIRLSLCALGHVLPASRRTAASSESATTPSSTYTRWARRRRRCVVARCRLAVLMRGTPVEQILGRRRGGASRCPRRARSSTRSCRPGSRSIRCWRSERGGILRGGGGGGGGRGGAWRPIPPELTTSRRRRDRRLEPWRNQRTRCSEEPWVHDSGCTSPGRASAGDRRRSRRRRSGPLRRRPLRADASRGAPRRPRSKSACSSRRTESAFASSSDRARCCAACTCSEMPSRFWT